MSEILLYTIFLLPVVLGAGILYWQAKRTKRNISSRKKKDFYAAIESAEDKSPSEKMIAYDKILSLILRELWYSGSVADQLKRKPKVLWKSLEAAWRLHKTRNIIAHELRATFDEENEPKEFEKLLRTILHKV